MTKHIQMFGRIASGMRSAGAIVALIAGLALTACGGGGGGAAAPAPPAACETNNTAEVAFRNNGTGSSYDIIWDGANIGRLASGVTGLTRDVSAGTAHTLAFRLAGTSTNACTPSTPNLARCTSTVFVCSG